MKSTSIVAVTLCLVIPTMGFAQANRAASPSTRVSTPKEPSPGTGCCGQAAEASRFSTPEEEIQFTQLSIHLRLLDKSSSPTLSPGVHLISNSPDGYKFQATVSKTGVVSNWFVAAPSGLRMAQVNSNGGGDQVDVNRCMEEFLRRTEFCEWQGTFDSQYNYNRCYWEAWRSFLGCLERGGSGLSIR